MIYCIDSHTFIWAVKKQADDHDAYRLKEADRFLKWIKDRKHQILLPSVILAECLIKEPTDKHTDILVEAHKTCIVANFDDRCALKYGELLRLDKWDKANEIRKLNNIRREKMKIDHMILACALVNGAHGIFTEDDELIKFAQLHIKVLPMPKIGVQTSVFDGMVLPESTGIVFQPEPGEPPF